MVYVLELGILSCRGYLHILHPHFEARYTNSSTEQNIKKNTKPKKTCEAQDTMDQESKLCQIDQPARRHHQIPHLRSNPCSIPFTAKARPVISLVSMHRICIETKKRRRRFNSSLMLVYATKAKKMGPHVCHMDLNGLVTKTFKTWVVYDIALRMRL